MLPGQNSRWLMHQREKSTSKKLLKPFLVVPGSREGCKSEMK